MRTTRPVHAVLALALATLAGCATSYPIKPEAADATPPTDGDANEQTASPAAPMANRAPAFNSDQLASDLEDQSARRDRIAGAGLNPWDEKLAAAPERLTTEPTDESPAALVDGLENLSQLTFASEGADFDPRLSKDGQWLIYASTQHRETPDLYIKRVGSRTVTQLTADPAGDIMPALSPDNEKVAFSSNRSGAWQLYLMSSRGGQAVQLTTQSAHELHPTWSPDGKRLAFSRLGQTSGRWEIWVMEVDKPQVAEFVGFGLFPEWCPAPGTGADGRDKILFQRGRERGDRAFSLWTIDYKPGDASNPTEIVSARGRAAINASWSPDGKFVVYSTLPADRPRFPAEPRPADLWIAAVDGSAQVRLTAGNAQNLMPAWGADNRIYFVSTRGGMDHIWSITADKALAAAGAAGQGQSDVANVPTEPATGGE